MRRPPDAVVVLSTYVALIIGLPSRLTFAPLGGAGSPAVMLGLLCLGWWIYWEVQRVRRGETATQPVRLAYFLMLLAFMLSFIASAVRPAVSEEPRAALLGMLTIASFGGVVLVANDGPPTRERFETLVQRIVFAGGALASLAIIQFITGQSWVDRISIPGLSYNQSLGGVSTRSGLNRPAGTALHAIELGVVLTMILPLAVNLALVDRKRTPLRRWAPVLLILFASFICISRSALIGVALGMLVIAMRWPRDVRRVAIASAPLFLMGLFVTVPGLLGSLLGLFTGIGSDSSAESRTGSYALAFEFVKRSPIIGRGFATFLPSYRIFDNEYLLLLVEVGLVGLLCTLGVFVTAIICAGRVRAARLDARSEQLGQALMASVVVGATCMALFDGFAFPMAAGVLFLMTGLCGAAWRLVRQEQRAPGATEAEEPPVPDVVRAIGRRWYVVGAGLAFTAAATLHVHSTPGVYWTQSDVVFLRPQSDRYPNTIQDTSSSVIATAGLVAAEINGVDTRPSTSSAGTTLAGEMVRDGYRIRLPDLGGQWAHNFSRSVLDVQVIGPDSAQVRARQAELLRQITAELAHLQDADHVAANERITIEPAPTKDQLFYLAGKPTRAAAATLLFGGCCTIAIAIWIDRLMMRRRRRHRGRRALPVAAPTT